MEQSFGHQLIVDSLLIVLVTIVLSWLESRGRHGAAVARHRIEQRLARARRPPAPGRKAA